MLAVLANSPAAMAATENNYALAASVSYARLTPAAGGTTITGLSGGVDGRVLILVNLGADSIILNNADAGSDAANQILTAAAAAVTMLVNNTVMLIYDATTQRWRQVPALAVL